MRMGRWTMLVMMVCLVLLPLLAVAQEAVIQADPAAPAESPMVAILGAALAISEGLALIPALKSNGILHFVLLLLRKLNGKSVPVVLLAVGLLALAGCSGVSTNYHELGGGQYLVQRTMNEPEAFGSSTTWTWLEGCAGQAASDAPATSMTFTDCHKLTDLVPYASPGWFAGMFGSAVQAGAIVGAGALIGDGAAQSGSSVSQSQSQSMTGAKGKHH
mgnify:CR=1 FL=1